MKVSINTIAELSGVSRGTVDRVLHGRPGVREEVRIRVENIIRSLDYTPNLAGKALVSQNKNILLGVVLAPDFHPFVEELKNGIRSETEKIREFGVLVDIKVIKSLDAEEQLKIINRLERRNISGLAIVPIATDAVTQRLRELSDKGIPVVTFNSDLPGSGRICFVGQNNTIAGQTACGLMETILPYGAEIAVISSSGNLECHRHRLNGFRRRLCSSPGHMDLVSVDYNFDRDDLSFRIIRKYSELYPNLSGIYLTGGGASGLGKGLKDFGMNDSVKVISHDLVPPVIELMREGIIKFTIGQDPLRQGALAVRILFDSIFKKKAPLQEEYFTGIDIRTIDNI